MKRRQFLGRAASTAATAATVSCAARLQRETAPGRPNLVFVFGDQWRAQATGYAGDPNAITPNLDRLASQSVRFTHAVSGNPVCSPYRASLMTGQYWLTHGVFMNDVCLRSGCVTIAEALSEAGYDTGYVGKWHLDGHGRSSFIPRERRQGFQFWKALECTHEYNRSFYYGDTDTRLQWDGYDAIAQTREAQEFIRNRAGGKPFALFVSWGPPHEPYETAPEQYRKLYDAERIRLRPNVPADHAERARRELAGYYAHISALDACVGEILDALRKNGIDQETVFVFTSDHGDLLHSLGREKKQQPFDESIRVPFLLRYPARPGARGRTVDTLLNTPDIMPTLLGLCGVGIPGSIEGRDYSRELLHGTDPKCDAALLMCVAPFGQWPRSRGGREYRGIRTKRYTYVRDLQGPWVLYDNETDPYQLENLCNRREHARLQSHLDKVLAEKLRDTHDEFRPGEEYLAQWGYKVDKTGTVPYAP